MPEINGIREIIAAKDGFEKSFNNYENVFNLYNDSVLDKI